MQIRSYKQAIEYLEGFIGKIRFEITPEFIKKHDPLERMRVLLGLLGNPQEKFKSVLVGGTSGKGSTAYLISHILTTAGYETGLTISPHLQKINERIQINGQPVSDEQFLGMVSSIVDTIELMKKMEIGAASYFEIIVAMAFLYFAQQKVDVAVVEVGMGGEYDATNTLYPLVAVLTNVSLDHTNVLGGTVQKIARTKVGIIKGLRINDKGLINNSSLIIHHLPVVTGVKQPSVVKIVEDKCKEVGAEVFRLHKDFDFKIKKESLEGSVFDFHSCHSERSEESKKMLRLEPQHDNLILSLLGKHQVENASLAIETVLQLKRFGLEITEEHIRKALKTAFFPGRFEILRLTPFAQDKTSSTLVLDGAHNPTKMRAFLSSLKKLYPRSKKVFVIGFKNDKDIKSMLRQILKVADILIVTEFKAKTDMSNNASAEALNIKYQTSNIKHDKKTQILIEGDSAKALEKAFELAETEKDSIIVVTGSLYLVGEVRSML